MFTGRGKQVAHIRRLAVAVCAGFVWTATVTSAGVGDEDEGGGLTKFFAAKVVGVAAGDALLVEIDGEEHEIGLWGIDAPENGQTDFEEAMAAARELVDGQKVVVRVMERDTLRGVTCVVRHRGSLVNLAMVRGGWAWAGRGEDDRESEALRGFAAAERRARRAGAGIWKRDEVEAPWEWRAANAPEDKEENAEPAPVGVGYWLNTKTDVRHNGTCRHYRATAEGRVCEAGDGRACRICGG